MRIEHFNQRPTFMSQKSHSNAFPRIPIPPPNSSGPPIQYKRKHRRTQNRPFAKYRQSASQKARMVVMRIREKWPNFVLNILKVVLHPTFLKANHIVVRWRKTIPQRTHSNSTVFADPFQSPSHTVSLLFPLAEAETSNSSWGLESSSLH